MIRLLLAILLFSTVARAQTVGPCVGSVGSGDAFFLYRPGEIEMELKLSVLDRVLGDGVEALFPEDFERWFLTDSHSSS